MATKTYTLSELKALILAAANKIPGLKTSFTSDDSDEAYYTAVQELSFEFPESTDTDKDKKYLWLKKRMVRWFWFQVLNFNLTLLEEGDIKSSLLVKQVQIAIDKLDAEFLAARQDPQNGSLFVDVTDVYGSGELVSANGLEEDRIGVSIEDRS